MILSGKKASKALYTQFINLKKVPNLVAIYVGDNPASKTYLKIKEKTLKKLGFGFKLIHLGANIKLDLLLQHIHHLNDDPKVDGIIIQLPLPEKLSRYTQQILDAVNPNKDVDCLNTFNIGKFYSGESDFMPATPQGILDLLDYYKITVQTKHVVVIGRSNLVGKPLAFAFTRKDATVTICHSKTINLQKFTRQADIIVSAVGKAKFLTGDFFIEGQTIIDVGTSLDELGKLSGDVDFENVSKIVANITPVPGGVGPMTVYGLVKNLVRLSNW